MKLMCFGDMNAFMPIFNISFILFLSCLFWIQKKPGTVHWALILNFIYLFYPIVVVFITEVIFPKFEKTFYSALEIFLFLSFLWNQFVHFGHVNTKQAMYVRTLFPSLENRCSMWFQFAVLSSWLSKVNLNNKKTDFTLAQAIKIRKIIEYFNHLNLIRV